jgi:hypothetical protein
MIEETMFLREDFSKLENRINVAMFGVMAIDEFREWFLDRLALPRDSVVYPPRNLIGEVGSGRPDFVVRTPDEEVLAWIEVECWSNAQQLAAYRLACRERVIAIWGKPGPSCDLSLQEIAEYIDSLLPARVGQARFNFQHLRGLIHDIDAGGRSSTSRAEVSEAIWESSLVVGLRNALGPKLRPFTLGQGSTLPGSIEIASTDSKDNRGFGIRVYSRHSLQGNSVGIFNRKAGGPTISFNSKAWLEWYLRRHAEAIAALGRLIATMGGDVDKWKRQPERHADGRPKAHYTQVGLAGAEEHVVDLARVIDMLASGDARSE